MDVQYGQQLVKNIELVAVGGTGLGRDWLKAIMGKHQETSPWFNKESVVRSAGTVPDCVWRNLGTISPWKAKLSVAKDAKPKFFRAKPVPFALREKVDAELLRLEKAGVLEEVHHSEWATPIVVVPKGDGTVRICGDFKVTVNPFPHVDWYPLPKPEDLFATLSGGQSYTTLDLTHAYN